MGVKDNLLRVLDTIREAEVLCGRESGSVRLMAISKFHPSEAVLEAINAGQTLFGENRVQEATDKFSAIIERYPKTELHLVGTLQRNKVAKILPIATCVQSVDRKDILVEIDRRSRELGLVREILFEVHTGEESKAGYPDRDSLFASLDALGNLSSVRCAGLMTMAPFTQEERAVRASFRSLRETRDECARRYPSCDFSILSMGMSSDYRIAIEEGSTLVRIGTAIFGGRA